MNILLNPEGRTFSPRTVISRQPSCVGTIGDCLIWAQGHVLPQRLPQMGGYEGPKTTGPIWDSPRTGSGQERALHSLSEAVGLQVPSAALYSTLPPRQVLVPGVRIDTDLFPDILSPSGPPRNLSLQQASTQTFAKQK